MCIFFSSRRRHTRYWRDWSSDVCSSDLDPPQRGPQDRPTDPPARPPPLGGGLHSRGERRTPGGPLVLQGTLGVGHLLDRLREVKAIFLLGGRRLPENPRRAGLPGEPDQGRVPRRPARRTREAARRGREVAEEAEARAPAGDSTPPPGELVGRQGVEKDLPPPPHRDEQGADGVGGARPQRLSAPALALSWGPKESRRHPERGDKERSP